MLKLKIPFVLSGVLYLLCAVLVINSHIAQGIPETPRRIHGTFQSIERPFDTITLDSNSGEIYYFYNNRQNLPDGVDIGAFSVEKLDGRGTVIRLTSEMLGTQDSVYEVKQEQFRILIENEFFIFKLVNNTPVVPAEQSEFQ